jgi:hypothetical protein
MPVFVTGIQAFPLSREEGVDAGAKPRHDGGCR